MIALTYLRPYPGDDAAPSPNHDVRSVAVIEGIVLHATADGGDEAHAITWMRSPRSRASCHLLVGRTGRVTRLVGDRHRAWHAGLAQWRGTTDVNSITLGIEIANRNDGEPYSQAQYRRVAEIVAHYCRQGLALENVVSHRIVAGGRKSDPLGWDWERFRGMVQDRVHATPALAPGRIPGATRARRVEEVARRPEVGVPAPAPATVQVPPLPTRPPMRVPAAPAATTRHAPAPVPPRKKAKPAVRSRTIWVNGSTVLAALAMLVTAALDLVQDGLALTSDVARWALFCVGLLNIFLRFQTTCPVGSRCAEASAATDGNSR